MLRWANRGESIWLYRVRQPHVSQLVRLARSRIVPPVILTSKSG